MRLHKIPRDRRPEVQHADNALITTAHPAGCHTPTSSSTDVTDVDPEQLEQVARSLAMAPVLGERDRHAVIDALRRLAVIERAKRRHPSGGK